MKQKFSSGDVPLPTFWGGYRIRPTRFEFWQGRPNRLHDRVEYVPSGEEGWTRQRLSP
jgi:pyridoxamine 5'-phosphate oxidase